MASGLVTKILWATTTPPHPQLLSMKEVSNNKTQRLKVNQYDPLYLLSIKNQVDSKRENMDESNMFKENIIKEMFLDSLWYCVVQSLVSHPQFIEQVLSP